MRDATSLTQTCGRAARHIDGKVILYAERETRSMRKAIDEMRRRRTRQTEYNKKHGITPRGIKKNIKKILDTIPEKDYVDLPKIAELDGAEFLTPRQLRERMEELKKEMLAAAGNLEFERAAVLRDQLLDLEKRLLEL